jgi:hypothetical protein
METQVTVRLEWVTVESHGETFEMPKEDFEPEQGEFISTRRGYGVRESAPGYLDCTEWEVFDTLAEAEARAAEIDAEYNDDLDAVQS